MAKCHEVAQHCAGFSVRRAARAVANLYDDILAPSGLRGTQFSLLNAVAVARAPTISHLAELLLMDRTTLSRNLKPLEQQGLIRITGVDDRRAKGLIVTAKGVRTLRRALPLWDEAQRTVTVLLGATRLKRLRADLKELEQVAQQH